MKFQDISWYGCGVIHHVFVVAVICIHSVAGYLIRDDDVDV